MGWRTVVISSRVKLELKLNYLVIRGEVEKKIFLDEIDVLMIENTSVSLTCSLLHALLERKINVIFCDNKRLPYASLVSLYGSYDASDMMRKQIAWSEYNKKLIWTEIVKEKILNQSGLLAHYGFDESSKKLINYTEEIHFGDETNREGHAAKVYFNTLFGNAFSRGQETKINAGLNYGYQIILSCVARDIVSNGFLTSLGIFHSNTFNYFNLASDLMEPFRPIVDQFVLQMPLGEENELTSEDKQFILKMLETTVYIDNSKRNLLDAIMIYTRCALDAICNGDVSDLRFFRYEF
ncbi:type II CRISPR-associated endonuclease Cas1 [Bullifex sp.]|uniref:type II CRISPR-associated endonuclease Cas1 n=1 Tax=Bullifex sp. TaxID=2815808 RepID=UPI002A809C2F|nr:type II CRISPR-associated endonuclease Cas1 [Bullifex sp.]MDY4066749.1 type II CRISPR-associated endonuclease Cas1 [Bullifex sp.]